MSKGIVSLVFVLLLSACAIGPDYRRPSIQSPEAWRFGDKEAKDVADTQWWEQFDDTVLNQLIGEALQENKDVRIAAARVEEFLGRYGVARSAFFPQVAASGIGQEIAVTRYTNPPWSFVGQNPYSDYRAIVSASWELDIWGRIRRANEAARADLLSTEEGRRGVILSVVTATAIAYTDLLALDRQLEIAQGTARSREDSLNLFRLRFDRGLISELELHQADSEYQLALSTIPLLQKLIGQQENALSLLIGRNPGPIPRGNPLDRLELPAVPAGLPSELLERRPDIRQAEEGLIAANARIGVAKAAYFPVISLTGFYGAESLDLSRLFMGRSRIWTYAVPVTMPIFTAGGIAGSVKAARAVQTQSLLRYQQVIQQAFKEVEDALIDQRKSREQLAIQAKQVESLRSYAGLANLRYENGYTSYLEVLDAQRSLFNAELAYTQTKGILFRALVNLYKSLGGGWVVEADKLTPG